MPKLSVVIPTFNRAGLLPRAVDSVRRAGTDLEIIVVDNASTDDTPQVCARLQGIRYLRLDRNTGEGGARNIGIKESRSDYVAFLDDDDLRLPDSLDRQWEVLEQNREAALVYGPVLMGDEQDCRPTGQTYPDACPTGDVFWDLLTFNFIPMPSVVGRKRHLIETGLFETSMKPVRDWDLWLRVAEKFPVAAVREPVAIYRKWNTSASQISANPARMYPAAAAVQAKALRCARAQSGSAAIRSRIRRQFLDFVSDGLLYEAAVALADGHKRAAWADVAAALRLQPWRVVRSQQFLNLITGSHGK